MTSLKQFGGRYISSDTATFFCEIVNKIPRNYFILIKVAIVDQWSMWWNEIVVSANGGYWSRAVTEIKMRWKGFSWRKMTLVQLVHFSGRVGAVVPSCQYTLFNRVCYKIHFIEYSVKGMDNSIKPIHKKPVETFRSQTLKVLVFIGFVPCTQFLSMSALQRSLMAYHPEVLSFMYYQSLTYWTVKIESASSLVPLELEI